RNGRWRDLNVRIRVPRELSWSPSELLIAGADTRQIAIWEVATGREVAILSGMGMSVTWISDDILAYSTYSQILLWSASKKAIVQSLQGHPSSIRISASCDQRLLASCGLDGTVCIWELTEARIVGRLPILAQKKPSPFGPLAFHP